MSYAMKSTVLLIEADTSLRRLIALGLQYRGMHILEASSLTDLPVLEAHSPDLLVLDVDGKVNSDSSLLTAVQAHPYLSTLPIILLAWECPVLVTVAGGQQNTLQTQCLAKPFDARTLHASIEQLLAAKALQEAAQAQELPFAAQAAAPAPSIWPFLTAAGLLLAFIGLMGLLALTIFGLLVIVVSLLWWTLGTNTKKRQASLPAGTGNS